LILKSKSQCAKAFQYTEIDDNDLTYFIEYKLRTIKLAFESLREYIQRKIDEKRQNAELIKLKGINDRQALILKWYYEEPSLVLSVKEVETRMGISNQTARSDLQNLVSLNFLESIRMNLKTEAFVKSENFDSLIKSKVGITANTFFS
jgi:Fic family protein